MEKTNSIYYDRDDLRKKLIPDSKNVSKQVREEVLYNIFKDIRQFSDVVQIFGRAASGKSTLAMNFIKMMIAESERPVKIIYIDTENKFSVKRYNEIGFYSKYFVPPKKLTDSLWLIRPKSYYEQGHYLSEVISNNEFLNSDNFVTPLIIWDTTSNLARHHISSDKLSIFSQNLQFFYEDHILPLRQFQKRKKAFLILIHQVSYDPHLDINKPVFFDLFKQINSVWINMDILDTNSNLVDRDDYRLRHLKEHQTYDYSDLGDSDDNFEDSEDSDDLENNFDDNLDNLNDNRYIMRVFYEGMYDRRLLYRLGKEGIIFLKTFDITESFRY